MSLLAVGIVVAIGTSLGPAPLSPRMAAPPGGGWRLSVVPILNPEKLEFTVPLSPTDHPLQDVFDLYARWFAGEDVPIGEGAVPTGAPGPYTGNAETIFAHLQVREQPVASRPPRPHPAPFADRDRFLADLFGPQVEWFPPRTASADDWRTWLNAHSPQPHPPTCYLVRGNGRSYICDTVDPWVMEWLATAPPGPSWLTLTDDDKWPATYGVSRENAGRLKLGHDGRHRVLVLTP
jgi:hypothetical protein